MAGLQLVDIADDETTIPYPATTCADNSEGGGHTDGTGIDAQVGVDAVPIEGSLPCPEHKESWVAFHFCQPSQMEHGPMKKHEGASPFELPDLQVLPVYPHLCPHRRWMHCC